MQKREGYEEKVAREEGLHSEHRRLRENKKAWDRLSPAEYDRECGRLDSISLEMHRAGLTGD